jgi:hypothetical protein
MLELIYFRGTHQVRGVMNRGIVQDRHELQSSNAEEQLHQVNDSKELL